MRTDFGNFTSNGLQIYFYSAVDCHKSLPHEFKTFVIILDIFIAPLKLLEPDIK